VIASLQEDATLDASAREFGIEVARTHCEDHLKLSSAAWQTAAVTGRKMEAYTLALRQAEAAVLSLPDTGFYLCTLGAAQYRLGQFAEALVSLSNAEKIQGTNEDLYLANLALLAMTHHQLAGKVGKLKQNLNGISLLATTYCQLSHMEQAQSTLAQLREAAKNQSLENSNSARSFLCEAEELIEECEAQELNNGRQR
jgi:cytochrome c-type biogenesis protein CcmH/NrfG